MLRLASRCFQESIVRCSIGGAKVDLLYFARVLLSFNFEVDYVFYAGHGRPRSLMISSEWERWHDVARGLRTSHCVARGSSYQLRAYLVVRWYSEKVLRLPIDDH